MTCLCVPNFDSAPSSMPKLWPINHFPKENPLVPGLKLRELVQQSHKLMISCLPKVTV